MLGRTFQLLGRAPAQLAKRRAAKFLAGRRLVRDLHPLVDED